MELDEVLSSPGFWLLGIGGLSAEILGYTWSRNAGMDIMPFWQLMVMMLVTLAAAAFFGSQE